MDKLKVRSSKKGIRKDSTEISLMVESHSQEEICDYDESKIKDALIRELSLSADEAQEVSETVTSRIKKAMSESLSKTIDTALIRSFVNVVLYEKGLTKQLLPNSDIVISAYDVKQIIESASKENGNMEHNPESINFTLAERVIKEYVMKHIIDGEISKAHLAGEIHVHDLGSFTRAYCSGHSIEYVKVNGIRNIPNIPSTSGPAMHAGTLARHICSLTQFLSSIFAGAIGWEALNVFFSPFLVRASDDEMIQLAQTLMFDLSQMAGAKGGQVSFTDFNLYITVPEHYRETYAIHPGGYYYGTSYEDGYTTPMPYFTRSIDEIEHWEKEDPERRMIIKYKHYESVSQRFLSALLKVAKEGDKVHLPFSFPKLNLHINEDTFTKYQSSAIRNDATMTNGIELYEGIKSNTGQKSIYCHREDIPLYQSEGYSFRRISNDTALALLDEACEVSSINGGIYFLFDRSKFSMAQCCRLKVTIDADDSSVTREPGNLRFVGLQNVSINLPNAALKVKHIEDTEERFNAFMKIMRDRMSLAVRAHVIRRDYLKYITGLPNSPLRYYANGMDGKPYVDFNTASYLIGIVGLNECVYNLTGSELHLSHEAYTLGLEIIIRMNDICKELGQMSGLSLKLEETPAESTATRFATLDLQKYGDAAFVKSNEFGSYYTNSIHLAYDANISFVERIIKQSRFHPFIEAGSIIHGWVGDRLPDVQSVRDLVQTTWYKTQCEQFTISPDLTSCTKCKNTFPGFREVCPSCGDERYLFWTTRVTGYYVNVDKFNSGKRAELAHRVRVTHNKDEVQSDGKQQYSTNSIQQEGLPELRIPH